MLGWGHDTPWRQGHILTAATSETLGLKKKDEEQESVVVVISHDCDLAHDDFVAEPFCEVIVGKVIDEEKAAGRYREAKNSRRLHLTFKGGDTEIAADLEARHKSLIKKSDLVPPHLPAVSVRLTPDELSTLQRWLALRYRRSSFPNEFNSRMKMASDKLGKIIDRAGDNITAIFFSVDKGHDVERAGEDDVYMLRMVLVENSDVDSHETAKSFSQARRQILDLFKREFRKGDSYKLIELEDVVSTSDEEMTLRMSWRLKEWH